MRETGRQGAGRRGEGTRESAGERRERGGGSVEEGGVCVGGVNVSGCGWKCVGEVKGGMLCGIRMAWDGAHPIYTRCGRLKIKSSSRSRHQEVNSPCAACADVSAITQVHDARTGAGRG